jgi:hypothetical protein
MLGADPADQPAVLDVEDNRRTARRASEELRSATSSRNDETRLAGGLQEYRYGDSNPGFRRERAAS